MRTVAVTGSTNADMLALAADGVPEGTWLRAERQTAGRGRQARRWVSPVGNLYASTLVRLRPGDPPAAQLALVAGVALWESVEAAFAPAETLGGIGRQPCHLGDLVTSTAPQPLAPAGRVLERSLALKWPNDLLLDGKKLAGILLERAGDAVVVGIGLNCQQCPEHLDQPATSLRAHGVRAEPAILVDQIAALFEATVMLWREEGFEPIRKLWLERAHPVGTPLAVGTAENTRLEGVFDAMSGDGALILRLPSGQRRTIYAGDVAHLDRRSGAG